MKKIFTLKFLAIFLFSASTVFAQKATVSGVITDDKNQPFIGATVSLQNTTIAAMSDIDGKYKLENIEPGKYTFLVTFLGYVTQKENIDIKPGQNMVINKTLKEDIMQLGEVVVVGYGRRQKRDVTGSIETIQSKDIDDIVSPSFDQVLQGQAAGVQVTAENGIAGAPVKIDIRGTSSISAGSEPLYVIDGIPMTTGNYSAGNLGSLTNALEDIDPNDIENIEVLKDAAATAIYGSRGRTE